MKLFVVFLILFSFVILAQTHKCPEQHLLDLLENHYANLHVNNEFHKRNTLLELKYFLNNNKLNSSNFEKIQTLLNNFNDGHIFLVDSTHSAPISFKSGLEFFPGSFFIKKCSNCFPALPLGKYNIMKVGSLSLEKFLSLNSARVAASSLWGNQYRVKDLLVNNPQKKITNIKVVSSDGITSQVNLFWTKDSPVNSLCTKGERLSENVYKLSIFSFWCLGSRVQELSRSDIFKNFTDSFDHSVQNIKSTDKIILDLRENGGGGDKELGYALDTFVRQSIVISRDLYLRKNSSNLTNLFFNYIHSDHTIWLPESLDFNHVYDQPKLKFFDNKIVTLVSAGCFSACEVMASVFKISLRSKLVGTRTHGAAGDPKLFKIIGSDFLINLPTCLSKQSNGLFYEGVGVLPDKFILQDPSDKRDTILLFSQNSKKIP